MKFHKVKITLDVILQPTEAPRTVTVREEFGKFVATTSRALTGKELDTLQNELKHYLSAWL